MPPWGDDREAAKIHAIAIERVPRDVKPEGLLLTHERLPQIPRLDLSIVLESSERPGAIGGFLRARLGEESEHVGLAAFAIATGAAGSLEGAFDGAERPRPGNPTAEERSVERAALDEGFENTLVHAARVDPLGEVKKVGERPTRVTCLEDRVERGLPNAADRAQPEADLRIEEV